MNTIDAVRGTERNDTELVAESLVGDRDAFRQIVERYQTLISSVAYCATGNISQSEDLAQETFVAAWRELPRLREPARLRSWLCSITRFLISKEFRREGREPAHAAESLAAVDEWVSPEPLPPDHVISEEEKAILWRSIERIPEIYREPLILFYREQQSIEAVARDLELSEDAVKQRLSRGRKLLQEQFLAFVAGALKQTTPGKTFTLAVIAALPLMATTAKAATAGATVAKGGTAAKGIGLFGLLQTALKAIVPIGMFVSLGSCLGFVMGRDATGQSRNRRDSVARFWGVMVGCLALFVLLPILLWGPLNWFFGSRDNLHAAIRKWLDILFVIMAGTTVVWVWQRRKSRPADAAAEGTKRTFLVWAVTLAMIGTAAFFALGLSDSNWKINRVSTAEAQKIILEKGVNAECFVFQFQDGRKELWIKFMENGKLSKIIAPADSSSLTMLAKEGVSCPTYVQGRDFEIFGWQGKLLMGLCLVLLAAGAAIFVSLFIKKQMPLMTRGTKFSLAAVVLLAALIVIPLVVSSHRKSNSVQPNRAGSETTPADMNQARQTAVELFAALGKGDWNVVTSLCQPGWSLADKLTAEQKDWLMGLKLLNISEPFAKAPYPGIFVPYEIQFKNGGTKKHNLAVRNDNPAHKWYFDGGL